MPGETKIKDQNLPVKVESLQGSDWITEQAIKRGRLPIKESVTISQGRELAERITGISPDNPQMPELLLTDQRIIRQKYGLPSRDAKFIDPVWVECVLKSIIKREGVDLKSKLEYNGFFEEHSANALQDIIGGRNTIVADINRNEGLSKYFGSLTELEHELIHALQDKYYPRMPIEQKEYEAYVGTMNMERMVESPDNVENDLFGFFIATSVGIHNKTVNH